jgi:hypothetical protein
MGSMASGDTIDRIRALGRLMNPVPRSALPRHPAEDPHEVGGRHHRVAVWMPRPDIGQARRYRCSAAPSSSARDCPGRSHWRNRDPTAVARDWLADDRAGRPLSRVRRRHRPRSTHGSPPASRAVRVATRWQWHDLFLTIPMNPSDSLRQRRPACVSSCCCVADEFDCPSGGS